MHESEFASSENSQALDGAAASEFSPSPSSPHTLGKQVAPWWHTILFVLILVSISALGALSAKKPHIVGHQMVTYISTIIFEWLMLAFVWWGLWLRGVSLRSMLGRRFKGWSGFGRDVAYAAVFWIISLIVLSSLGLLFRYLHLGKSGPAAKVLALAPHTPFELFLWLLVCATAGFCEELIFRGYFLHQFSSLGGNLSITGKITIGVILSSLVFGASHGYEGIAAMTLIFIYGILFCLLRLISRNLRPGMFAHAWHDFFAGVAIVVLQHLHRLPH